MTEYDKTDFPSCSYSEIWKTANPVSQWQLLLHCRKVIHQHVWSHFLKKNHSWPDFLPLKETVSWTCCFRKCDIHDRQLACICYIEKPCLWPWKVGQERPLNWTFQALLSENKFTIWDPIYIYIYSCLALCQTHYVINQIWCWKVGHGHRSIFNLQPFQ